MVSHAKVTDKRYVTFLTSAGQKAAARKFVERWQQAGSSEDREARSYRIELCQNVLGIANPT